MPVNYKKYPSNWLTEIRPAILARANNCCECCGVDNYMIRRFVNGKSQTDNYENQSYAEAKALAKHMNEFCDDGLGRWSIIVLTIAHLDLYYRSYFFIKQSTIFMMLCYCYCFFNHI